MVKRLIYFDDGVGRIDELDGGISVASRTLDANAGFQCYLSMVNGNAFIHNPSTGLGAYIGKKVTLQAGGKTLVGWIDSKGTGETTTDLVTGNNSTFASDTGFWTKSAAEVTISGGKANWTNSDVEQGLDRAGISTSGVLYLTKMTVSSLTTGGVRWKCGTYGTTRIANGTYTEYLTGSFTAIHILATVANPTNLKVDDVTFASVDTASFGGVRIVSTSGGSTYNWASDDGIDPNAGTFTVTISVS